MFILLNAKIDLSQGHLTTPASAVLTVYSRYINSSSFFSGLVKETNQLRMQLQQAQSVQLISNEMNKALQVGLLSCLNTSRFWPGHSFKVLTY